MTTKIELTEANVREALVALGHDPDAADWPSLGWCTAPAFGVVAEVMNRLGWPSSNRHARIIVGSMMQAMMMTAKRAA